MRTKTRSILHFLDEKEISDIVIPVYQRQYSWEDEQVEQLLEDVVELSDTGSHAHFFGTLFAEENGTKKPRKIYIVDGQQRLLTIATFLKALEVRILEMKAPSEEDNALLVEIASLLKENGRPRITPSTLDKDSFSTLMERKARPIGKSSIKLENAFRRAYDEIGEFLKRHRAKEFMIALSRLQVAYIALDKNDDVQSIFESINAFGKELTQADLVRNFLLMKVDDPKMRKKLYEDEYDKIVKELGENLDSFIRVYVLMKKESRIEEGNIYHEYVNYAKGQYPDGEIDRQSLIDDLYKWQRHYMAFVNPREWKKDRKEREAVALISEKELIPIGSTAPYPFLLKVLDDAENGIIPYDEAEKVFNLVVVYMVRTIMTTRRYSSIFRDVFLTLYKKTVEGKKIPPSLYYPTIYEYLVNGMRAHAMPTIEDAANGLRELSLFKERKGIVPYLLLAIENERWKDKNAITVDLEKISIEHIIPQNYEKWGYEKDDRWIKENLHKLGNLTLLTSSINSSASDRPFKEKKSILKCHGYEKMTKINGMIMSSSSWGKRQFKERHELLVKEFMRLYEIKEPENLDQVETSYESVEIDFSYCPSSIMEDASPIRYIFFGKDGKIHKRHADKCKDILIQVADMIYEESPEMIASLAERKWGPWKRGKKEREESNGLIRDAFRKENANIHRFGDSDIYLIAICRKHYPIEFLLKLMKECGYPSKSLKIFIAQDVARWETLHKVIELRRLLGDVAKEGEIIYEPNEMPLSNECIKFLSEKANAYWNKEEGETYWDEEESKTNAYFEYLLEEERLLFTICLKREREDFFVNTLAVKINGYKPKGREKYPYLRLYSEPLPLPDFSSQASKDEFKKKLLENVKKIEEQFLSVTLD